MIFKFKNKENARSQNYLRIVDEVLELIIEKLNIDYRSEVFPNTTEKDQPRKNFLKLNFIINWNLDFKIEQFIVNMVTMHKKF